MVRNFGATMQSTLIAFRGSQETGRLVGETDTQVIQKLLETTKG